MSENKRFGYDAFSKNIKHDSFRNIKNHYQNDTLYNYYYKLANLDKEKHLTEEDKKNIVEAHRKGGAKDIRKAAKLLGIKDEDKLKELDKFDDRDFKKIDEDNFDIGQDQEFDRSLSKGVETAKQRSNREAFERRLKREKSKSAGMRALTQALDVGKTESFVGRVPLVVKIWVPIIILALWLLGGVASCTFGF